MPRVRTLTRSGVDINRHARLVRLRVTIHRISLTIALRLSLSLLGEFLACVRLHPVRLRGHRAVLARRLGGCQRGASDLLRLGDGCFGIAGDGGGVDLHVAADGVLPAVRAGLVLVGRAATEEGARRGDVGLLVLAHLAVAGLELLDLASLAIAEFDGVDATIRCGGLGLLFGLGGALPRRSPTRPEEGGDDRVVGRGGFDTHA